MLDPGSVEVYIIHLNPIGSIITVNVKITPERVQVWE